MHLIDSFMPVIAYVVRFRSASAQDRPGFQEVKGEIRRLVAQSETTCRGAGIDPQAYDQARFMVCAWIDEALLASDWREKQLWQHEQLQRLYYNTTDAGVEVFDRLDALGPHNEVREVYSLCLALGFKGRYIGPADRFLLEQLKTSHLMLLLESPAGIPSLETMELFPGAMVINPTAAPKPPSFTIAPLTAIALSAPLILFGLLYLIYRYVLNGLVLPMT